MAKNRKQRAKNRHRPAASPPPPAPNTLYPLAALLLLVAAAYWPVFSADFVWDDKAFLEAPPVSGGLAGLLAIWFNPAKLPFEAHYWPMLYSSFWLEHKLWGFNPTGFHASNVLLHGVNTVLLWRLLTRMALPGAWLIAAVFALHPMRVEAVAWVIARKDLLATLFYLLACHCWLRFREQGSPRAYLALLILFAAAMFSKSMAITMPAALLVWAWWQHGRVTERDFLHTAPLFLLGIVIAAGDLSFYTGRAEIDFSYTSVERILIASQALWFYVGKLLWPLPLPVIYPHWDINPANLLNWLYLPAALALAAVLYLARHRIGRGPLAGVLFFAVTLSPMLGFGNNSYMEYSFVADRYQYLAGIGLLAVLIAAAVNACRRLPPRTTGAAWAGRGARALALLLLLCCGALTWRQARVYHNEITLFSHVVSLNPTAHSAHYNLGIALVEEGRLEEAEAAYKTEVQRDPSDPKYLQAINHLASLRFNEGSYEQARALYAYSAAVNPNDADTQQNLGSSLAQLRRYEEAIHHFQQALAIDPQLKIARDNMELARRMLEKGEGRR